MNIFTNELKETVKTELDNLNGATVPTPAFATTCGVDKAVIVMLRDSGELEGLAIRKGKGGGVHKAKPEPASQGTQPGVGPAPVVAVG